MLTNDIRTGNSTKTPCLVCALEGDAMIARQKREVGKLLFRTAFSLF